MTGEAKSDEQIIRSILKGNQDDFRLIVERYQNQIFIIGRRFFNNEDDASDFTQEVFIQAYRNLKSFRGLAPFRFWLFKIGYNYGINRKKSLKTDGDLPVSLPARTETPERDHVNDELRTIVQEAVRKLPEKYRICIDFYFFMGLSHKEISRITDFPVNTVKSHVLRAKRILKDKLEGTIAEEYHEL